VAAAGPHDAANAAASSAIAATSAAMRWRVNSGWMMRRWRRHRSPSLVSSASPRVSAKAV
jgi:hypothetical protein